MARTVAQEAIRYQWRVTRRKLDDLRLERSELLDRLTTVDARIAGYTATANELKAFAEDQGWDAEEVFGED